MGKYLHIITGLKTGGAEAMLFRLLEKDPELHTVLSLTPGGKYYKLLSDSGVISVLEGSHIYICSPSPCANALLRTKPEHASQPL